MELIPFDYQQKMVGVIHKWLGTNEIHDKISLYSFSWLRQGMIFQNGYDFPDGATWFISFYDDVQLKHLVASMLESPDMFCGLKVTDISIQETPDFSSRELFFLGSPILIKQSMSPNAKVKHCTYEDSGANELMKAILEHKMEVAGLPKDETLEICFDVTYAKRKIKYMNYKNIRNKASMCPIYIKGRPDTKAFAWNVGIGHSTGIGFGSIY